mmetsp:Transcript_36725/g.84510  ORF Transcript_36725/g.84510 Transcript_36725/m.84510 type:complete len:359 (-) Transcript_36725:76-1152(-)
MFPLPSSRMTQVPRRRRRGASTPHLVLVCILLGWLGCHTMSHGEALLTTGAGFTWPWQHPVEEEAPVLLDLRDSVLSLSEEVTTRGPSRVLVVLDEEVVNWWQEEVRVVSLLAERLTGPPLFHIKVYAPEPVIIRGQKVHGIQFDYVLPDGNEAVEDIRCLQEPVELWFEPFAGRRAMGLRLYWQIPGPPAKPLSLIARILRVVWFPWYMLFKVMLQHPDVNPITLIGGVLLIMTLVAILIVLVILLVIIAERHLTLWMRRRRRLFQVRALTRKAAVLKSETCFGIDQPCCICLGDSDSVAGRIVLLPCRHALHLECYIDWVQADVYTFPHLICPLCRHRTEAFGKLEVLPNECPVAA